MEQKNSPLATSASPESDGSTLFDEARQRAVLAYLIEDKEFFLRAKYHIQVEWWANPYLGKIWQALQDFFGEHGRHVKSVEELIHSDTLRLEQQEIRGRCLALIEQLSAAKQKYGLDILQKDLTKWFQTNLFKTTVRRSVEIYNVATATKNGHDRFTEGVELLRQGAIDIARTDFLGDSRVHFGDPVGYLQKAQEEYANGISFGVQGMDRLLNPVSTTGGLLRGDLTILLAPTNIGKTTVCITILRHNILARRHCLFVSHEGAQRDLYEKLLCAMLQASKSDLYHKYLTDPKLTQRLIQVTQLMNTYLTWVPMSEAGLTIEDVHGRIRRLQEEQVIKHGKGFDLVIDDYPAKLKVATPSREKRHDLEVVYDYFRAMAEEHNWHTVCPIQTNRTGSKINAQRKGQENRLLGPDDVQEAFGPMQLAANVISINRTPRMQAREIVTFFIGKSRTNDTGWAVACKSDFGHAITHSDSLGCTWYRSTDTASDRIDSLLESNKGSETSLLDLYSDEGDSCHGLPQEKHPVQ